MEKMKGSFESSIDNEEEKLRKEGFEDVLIPADPNKLEVFDSAVEKFRENGFEVREISDAFEYEANGSKRRIFVRKK